MDVRKQIEEILAQLNGELGPQDQVNEAEIVAVSDELNHMLAVAAQNASGPPPTTTRLSLRQRLAAIWQVLKDKLAAWFAPITPRWHRMLEALKARLQQLDGRSGHERLLALVMMAVGIAVVAALLKSLPLLLTLLAAVGFITLWRLIERVTRPALA